MGGGPHKVKVVAVSATKPICLTTKPGMLSEIRLKPQPELLCMRWSAAWGARLGGSVLRGWLGLEGRGRGPRGAQRGLGVLRRVDALQRIAELSVSLRLIA